jgi:hypothetical protein
MADLVAHRRGAGVADPPLDLYPQLLSWFVCKFDDKSSTEIVGGLVNIKEPKTPKSKLLI